MVVIDDRKATKWSKNLYSSSNRWYVVCDECHRVIANTHKYKKDTRVDYLPLMKEWAEMEAQRHKRRVHNGETT